MDEQMDGCPQCRDRFTHGLPGTPGYLNGTLVRSWYPHDQPPNSRVVQFYVQDDVRGLVRVTYTWSWKVEDVRGPEVDAEEPTP